MPPASQSSAPPDPLLRVLVLITRGEPGGAQVHVLELVRGLQARVDFHVGIGDDEFLAQELRRLGVVVHVVPELQRSVSVRGDVRALAAIRRLIRSVAPHLVHTHSTKAGLLGRVAARAEGLAAMHTAHAWSFSDGLPWQRRMAAVPVEILAGRVTNRFLVVSAADRAIALRCHVAREEQLTVVHNGVADTALRATPEAEGPPTIVMVARMAAPKDHDLLLRALAGIEAPFRLQLIGDGPDRADVERTLRSLGLADRTELTGVSNDVPRLLAAAHIGTLVSRQEGFPLAILEAMRAGLPVVASDVGGVREAVQDGVTGSVVARGDEAGLRSAFSALIRDPALRRTWGDAGRRAYEAQFTVERMLTKIVGVYTELARAAGWPLPLETVRP